MVILAAIGRHLFSGEYGVFDRFLELAVCALILYEVIVGIRQRRESWHRTKVINKRIDAVREIIAKGQGLQNSAPKISDPNLQNWVTGVTVWSEETAVLLKSYSRQAEVSFQYDSRKPASSYMGGAATYQALLASRLANLRGIMEKPEVYF